MEDNREKNQEEEIRLTIEAVNIDEKRDSISNIGKREID